MRTPYAIASEISHSVLRQQNAGWARGQTAAKACKQPTANKGLHLIREIWHSGELILGAFFFRGCTRRCRNNHSGLAEAVVA
jgi:hypothetical protein